MSARIITSLLAVAAALTAVAPASAGGGAQHYANCPEMPFIETVGGFEFEYCFENTVTPSGKANAHFHGALVDPSTTPASATEVTGFPCAAGFPFIQGTTTDSRLVITPSGRVNGSCKLH